MEPTAGGTAPPTGHVGAWNPHKMNAPKPPVTNSQGSSSVQQGSLVTANISNTTTTNYPDVTLDSGNANNPEITNNEDNLPVTEQTVIPDYPLDSLQRPTRTSTSSQNSQGTRQAHNSGNAGTRIQTPRESDNVQRIGSVNVSRTQQAGSSSVTIPSVTTMSPRTGGGAPPNVRTVAHPGHVQPVVSHSNVSVNVTSAPPNDANRHIRTQDLNVGVSSSRMDIQRQTTSALPDLIAHSQIPPPTARPTPTAQRPQGPVDPRAGGYVSRHGDPHSRSRHHHGDRRHRSRRHSHRNSTEPEEPCKESCFKCIAVTTSFRWILVVLSLLGVCCVVTGIVLAALHATGNSYLFLAIMFIGLGVLLVVVVGVGWKCTPRGHEPLHALFGLGDFRRPRSGRRHRSHHRREGRWHGGVMYPEFQFRRPPPSYNASMQDYQNQLSVTQQQPDTYDPEDLPDEDYSLPSSPPPSYRSRASTVRAGIQITFPPNQGGDFPDSRPPTYRSHPSNTLQGHRSSRPSLPRDEDDLDVDQAPADIAFTDAVFVDTNTTDTGTSIQITPSTSGNQNVTVSVTTVTVNSQSRPTVISNNGVESPHEVPQITNNSTGVTSQVADVFEVTDPVGELDGDRVTTSL